jgi:hypothetical protein
VEQVEVALNVVLVLHRDKLSIAPLCGDNPERMGVLKDKSCS